MGLMSLTAELIFSVKHQSTDNYICVICADFENSKRGLTACRAFHCSLFWSSHLCKIDLPPPSTSRQEKKRSIKSKRVIDSIISVGGLLLCHPADLSQG